MRAGLVERSDSHRLHFLEIMGFAQLRHPMCCRAPLRAERELLNRINVICPVQSALQKYFPSSLTQISSLSRAVPSHRGALRNVINAERDAVDAGSTLDESC